MHERAGSLRGLESAVRRLRVALADLAPGTVDVESLPPPPKLDSLVQEIRGRIGARPDQVGAPEEFKRGPGTS